jgi:hypothetical protein
MTELIVILGMLLVLTLWIAGHTIYRRQTDVLTGRYISRGDPEPAVAGERADSVSDAAAEEQRSTHASLPGWNLDQAEPKALGEVNPEAAGGDPLAAAPTRS